MLQDALGKHLFKSFIKNKKIEWETYSRHVTDYEIKRYLPIL
jgi:glutamine synthetase